MFNRYYGRPTPSVFGDGVIAINTIDPGRQKIATTCGFCGAQRLAPPATTCRCGTDYPQPLRLRRRRPR